MSREHVIAIDPARPLSEQPETGHNRWHEAIAPVVEVEPGDTVTSRPATLSTASCTPAPTMAEVGGAAPRAGPSADRAGVRQGRGARRPARGRAAVDRGRPVGPWGYTAEVPGFGFLRDDFPDPYLVHWTTARQRVRRVRAAARRAAAVQPVPGHLRPGPERRAARAATAREAELAERGGMALPPDAEGAVPAGEPIAREAPAHDRAARDGRQHRHQAD